MSEIIKTYIRVSGPETAICLRMDLERLGINFIRGPEAYYHFAEVHFLNREDLNLALTIGLLNNKDLFVSPMEASHQGYEVYSYEQSLAK